MDEAELQKNQNTDGYTHESPKSKLILAFVIILLLLLTVGLSFAFFSMQTEKNSEQSPEQSSVNTTEASIVSISTLEEYVAELEVCASSDEGTYEENMHALLVCFNKVHNRIQDISLCEQIKNSFLSDNYTDCVTSIATQNKDVTLCEKQGVSSTECYFKTAVALGEPTVCNNVSFNEPYSRNDCLQGVAVSSEDVKICELIQYSKDTDPNSDRHDLEDYYTKSAQKTKEKCFVELFKLLKDTEICEKADSDECYLEAGKETGSTAWCDRIENESITEDNTVSKMKCEYEIAKTTGNVALCGDPAPLGLDTDENKGKYYYYLRENHECFYAVAVKTGDEGICERLNYPYAKNHCYQYIATASDDIEVCKKISSDFGKNECFNHIAISTDNMETCNNITFGSFFLQNCYKKIAKESSDLGICEYVNTGYFEPDECGGQKMVDGEWVCEDIYDGERVKTLCLNLVANNGDTYESCRAISNDDDMKFECFYEKLLETKDPEQCKRILEENGSKSLKSVKANNCYLNLIKFDPDPKYCAQIDFYNTANMCYQSLSRIAQDRKYCELIVDDSWRKNDCLKNLKTF